MTDKEIDKQIHKLLGLETKYEVRAGLIKLEENLTLEEAKQFIAENSGEVQDRFDLSIISSRPEHYHCTIDEAMKAAQTLADRYDCTFILTYMNNDKWRGVMGRLNNCSEVTHEEPAMATCLAIIEYFK